MIKNKTVLVLDASSSLTQVGVLKDGVWLSFFKTELQALEGLFVGVDAVLKQAGIGLGDLDAFIYCEGPGSQMGIRIVAMALMVWKSLPEYVDKPVYSYKSFSLAITSLAGKIKDRFAVASNSRRGKCFFQFSDSQTIEEIDDSKIGDLKVKDVFFLANKLPGMNIKNPNFHQWGYDLEVLALEFQKSETSLLSSRDLAEIDALEFQKQTFQTWDHSRHRKTQE